MICKVNASMSPLAVADLDFLLLQKSTRRGVPACPDVHPWTPSLPVQRAQREAYTLLPTAVTGSPCFATGTTDRLHLFHLVVLTRTVLHIGVLDRFLKNEEGSLASEKERSPSFTSPCHFASPAQLRGAGSGSRPRGILSCGCQPLQGRSFCRLGAPPAGPPHASLPAVDLSKPG